MPEATTVAAVAWFLIVVAREWGGRSPHYVSIGLGLVFAAVLLVRPQRVLPVGVTATAAGLSIAAVFVAIVSPSGWAGASSAAAYVAAAWLALTVAAVVVRRPTASTALTGLIAVAAAIEFAEAWLPWWGGEVAARPMIGTFYWHNPFAAFLLPGALLGLVLWISHRRVLALVGILAFSLGTVGILYSTSRATIATLAVGVLFVAVLAVAASSRRRAAVRLAAAVLVGGGLSLLLSGPPFFPQRATAAAAVAGRAADQSLAQNGGYRLEFWHEALQVFRHHPIAGGGYHSMVAESLGRVPRSWALSPYAHNGYLQALSDGGLLLGIPILLAAAALVVIIVRLLIRAGRGRELSLSGVALPLALGAVLAHSAVDFDWGYAANLAMVGVLAGATLGGWLRGRTGSRTTTTRATLLSWAVVATAASCLVATAIGGWHGDVEQNLPVNDRAPMSTSSTT